MRAQIAAAVAFAAVCAASAYTYLDGRTTAAASAAPAGPPKLMGLGVGVASFGDVTAATRRAKLTCEDASLMAAMMKAHAAHHVDTSAPPSTMPSDHMALLKDPRMWQVRYACDGVPARLVGGAADVTGRLLFVHENANKPVQLIAYERHHTDPAAATADLTATLHALETRYGKPDVAHGGDELETLKPFEREWHVAGTIVRLHALAFGTRGTSISEEITLPPERG